MPPVSCPITTQFQNTKKIFIQKVYLPIYFRNAWWPLFFFYKIKPWNCVNLYIKKWHHFWLVFVLALAYLFINEDHFHDNVYTSTSVTYHHIKYYHVSIITWSKSDDVTLMLPLLKIKLITIVLLGTSMTSKLNSKYTESTFVKTAFSQNEVSQGINRFLISSVQSAPFTSCMFCLFFSSKDGKIDGTSFFSLDSIMAIPLKNRGGWRFRFRKSVNPHSENQIFFNVSNTQRTVLLKRLFGIWNISKMKTPLPSPLLNGIVRGSS